MAEGSGHRPAGGGSSLSPRGLKHTSPQEAPCSHRQERELWQSRGWAAILAVPGRTSGPGQDILSGLQVCTTPGDNRGLCARRAGHSAGRSPDVAATSTPRPQGRLGDHKQNPTTPAPLPDPMLSSTLCLVTLFSRRPFRSCHPHLIGQEGTERPAWEEPRRHRSGESIGAGGRAWAGWAPTPRLSFLQTPVSSLTNGGPSLPSPAAPPGSSGGAVTWPQGPGKPRWGADAARYRGGGAPQGPCAHREGQRQGSGGCVRGHAGRARSFKTVKPLVSDGFNSTFCTSLFFTHVYFYSHFL